MRRTPSYLLPDQAEITRLNRENPWVTMVWSAMSSSGCPNRSASTPTEGDEAVPDADS